MKRKMAVAGLLLLMLLAIEGFAQRTISGIVTNSQSQEPLPGTTIQVVGSSVAVTADNAGKFTLTIPAGITSPRLMVSFTGFDDLEVDPGNLNAMSIELTPKNKSMEEVVVVGYGRSKEVNLTGSVAVVSNKQLSLRQAGQTSMALQGLVPGLTVTQGSGQPGNDAGTISIRGIGTLGTAGQAPLVLVDGVEMGLNNIDPNDIESISVLKDASSAAIYGSRAANGVILVTTKRAKSGKISVSYNGYVGKQSPTNLPELVNGLDHMLMMNEARANSGLAPNFPQSYIDAYRQNAPSDLYPDTDWQDLTLTNNGLMHNHSLDVSGGSEFIRVRASINRLEQNGIIPNTGYIRTSLRVNTDIKASDKLAFKLDVRGNNAYVYEPGISPNSIFNHMNGRVPANQEGVLSNGLWGQGWLGENSVAAANASGRNEERTYSAIINAQADWKPVRGMNVNIMYTPEFSSGHNKLFRRSYQTYYGNGDPAYPNPSTTNYLTQGSSETVNHNFRALINYDFKVRNNHAVKLLAGYEQIEVSAESFTARRESFLLQDYTVLNAGSLINQQANGSGASEYGLISYFGRVNYNFREKYLFEANVRYDGSSRFASGNRFGLFPSFSAGWRISQEPFMDRFDFISNLKLRTSYGTLGNQNIGNYPFASSVSLTQNYIFNNAAVTGAALTQLGNSNISWESTTMFNVGVDARLWNKFNFTAEYYVRNTSDILLTLPIPFSTGLDAPYQNAGAVRNTGYDISVGYNGRAGQLEYGVDFVFSDVKNRITDLENTGPYITNYSIRAEGHPIDAIYGYQVAGYFQTQAEVDGHATQFGLVGPGDIKYVDQNKDGVIDANDRVVLGSNIPRYTYSLNLRANFKGFDFTAYLQGVGKANAYLSGAGVWALQEGSTAYTWHQNHWTPENPNAPYPRLTFGQQNNYQISDFWMYDASYLRVKNIQIGYTLPRQLLNKTFINNVRFWAAGQNLITFDNFLPGFDVETPSGSISRYPIVKVISVGIQANF